MGINDLPHPAKLLWQWKKKREKKEKKENQKKKMKKKKKAQYRKTYRF